jgi:hypothetical protein
MLLMSKLQEAGQFTLDGGLVDSFYDDNIVYKSIYRKFGKLFDLMHKEKLLKSDSKHYCESIYDYIIDEFGGVPDNVKIDDFLDGLLEDESFRLLIWNEDIIAPINADLEEEYQFYEEYYKSEEYWLENDYIVYEGNIDFSHTKLPSIVYKYCNANNVDEDKLAEFIEDTKPELDLEITYMNDASDKDTIVVWSSPIGEMEAPVKDEIEYIIDELLEVDESSEKEFGGKKGKYMYINLSYDIVNYTLQWKSIAEDFDNWLLEKKYITSKVNSW